MNDAKGFNEQVSHRAEMLRLLRQGERITDAKWKRLHPGARAAPTVERLRNAHGLSIEGDGSFRIPCWMPNVTQWPELVATTDDMKAAYYATEHWEDVRRCRREIDGGECVLCGSTDDLRCHHVAYPIFAEVMSDVLTVCELCHEKIHHWSKLKFPSGMRRVHVLQLGLEIETPEWLKPGVEVAGRLF